MANREPFSMGEQNHRVGASTRISIISSTGSTHCHITLAWVTQLRQNKQERCRQCVHSETRCTFIAETPVRNAALIAHQHASVKIKSIFVVLVVVCFYVPKSCYDTWQWLNQFLQKQIKTDSVLAKTMNEWLNQFCSLPSPVPNQSMTEPILAKIIWHLTVTESVLAKTVNELLNQFCPPPPPNQSTTEPILAKIISQWLNQVWHEQLRNLSAFWQTRFHCQHIPKSTQDQIHLSIKDVLMQEAFPSWVIVQALGKFSLNKSHHVSLKSPNQHN